MQLQISVQLTIPWNGNYSQATSSVSLCERLAILVSGHPNYTDGKPLGIPIIENSKGRTQADASFALLDSFEISSKISALVFDTIASNSGIHKVSAKIIEQ